MRFAVNLSVVSFFSFLGFAFISPILPQYALSFNIPLSLAGLAVSVFGLTRLFLDIPAGILADRYGKKRVMVSGLFILSLSSILTGLAPSFLILLIGRALMGLGSALYVTTANAWLAESTGIALRGRVMGFYQTFTFSGIAFGPALGGILASLYGLRVPFVIYSGLVVIGIIMTSILREERKGGSPLLHRGFKTTDFIEILYNRSFILVNFGVFGLVFIRTGVTNTLLPLYGSLNLGLTAAEIGLVLTVIAFARAFTATPSGWISDKIGRRLPLMIGLFACALAAIAFPFSDSLLMIVIIGVLFGLAEGIGPITAYVTDISPPKKIATAMGLHRMVIDMGFILGPIFATTTAEAFNPASISVYPFLLEGIVAIVAGVAVFWAIDPIRRRGKPHVQL